MSDEQKLVVHELMSRDIKVKSSEMIGDVLTITIEPNLLCVVERDGRMSTTTIKKGGQ